MSFPDNNVLVAFGAILAIDHTDDEQVERVRQLVAALNDEERAVLHRQLREIQAKARKEHSVVGEFSARILGNPNPGPNPPPPQPQPGGGGDDAER